SPYLSAGGRWRRCSGRFGAARRRRQGSCGRARHARPWTARPSSSVPDTRGTDTSCGRSLLSLEQSNGTEPDRQSSRPAASGARPDAYSNQGGETRPVAMTTLLELLKTVGDSTRKGNVTRRGMALGGLLAVAIATPGYALVKKVPIAPGSN